MVTVVDLSGLPPQYGIEVDEGQYGFWFEKRERQDLDDHILSALIALGVGNHKCLTRADWMSLVFVGAIVQELTGQAFTLPNEQPVMLRAQMPDFTWHILWHAAISHLTQLDGDFVASMLRLFHPVWHKGALRPLFRGSYKQPFVEKWPWCVDNTYDSTCHLQRSVQEKGETNFGQLKPRVQDAVVRVAEHIPSTLAVVSSTGVRR